MQENLLVLGPRAALTPGPPRDATRVSTREAVCTRTAHLLLGIRPEVNLVSNSFNFGNKRSPIINLTRYFFDIGLKK